MEEEINLKDLITKVKDWINYLIYHWKIIFLIGVLSGSIGLSVSWFKKPIYIASTTFVLENQSSGSSLGAYAGVAAQFGINLGGAEGNNLFAGDNIMEFMKSRLMVEKTLLTSYDLNNKNTLLVNSFIQSEELDIDWTEEGNPIFEFPSNTDRSNYTLRQDSLLNIVYKILVREHFNVQKIDKKLSIIQLSVKSKNENFAKHFCTQLLNNVSAFYIQTKTKKSKENVHILQSKCDSVKEALDIAILRRANFGDRNLNLVSQSAQISRLKAERDVQVLGTMYTELIKNLELSKFALAKEEPLIQVIDKPILPLEKIRLGKAKALVTGGMLGGVLCIIFLIIRRLYQGIMAS